MNVIMLNEPLDIELNAAILDIVTRVPPGGFEVADCAPDTWDELKAHLDAGRKLVVYSGGSEATIYGDPAVNYAFRAWHDYTHWVTDYDFSAAGERGVCEEQCRVLSIIARSERQAARWARIVRAEVIGQKLYHRLYDRFPEDQRSFAIAYMADPDKALSVHW